MTTDEFAALRAKIGDLDDDVVLCRKIGELRRLLAAAEGRDRLVDKCNHYIADNARLAEKSDAERAERLEMALRELVDIKNLLDAGEPVPDYLRRKPAAWAAARAALGQEK